MKTLHYVWTTFHNDGPCCVESVRAILRLGVDPSSCFVCDQVGKELRPPIRQTLQDLGVSVQPSRYTRRDQFSDLVARLQLITRYGGDACYLIDSDTIITTLEPARKFMASDAVAAAGQIGSSDFAGFASLYHVPETRTALAVLLKDNPLGFRDNVPDDVLTGRLMAHIYGEDRVWRMESYARHWNYGKEKVSLHDIRHFPAIHFGNKKEAGLAPIGQSIRDAIALTMKEFLTYL